MKRLLLLVLVMIGIAALRADDLPFDFEVLQYRAKSLAAHPYVARPSQVPEALRNLSYDQYRDASIQMRLGGCVINSRLNCNFFILDLSIIRPYRYPN